MAEANSASGLLGTLWINFTGKTTELTHNVEEAEHKVTHSMEVMEKGTEHLKHALELLGLALTVGEVVHFVKEVIEGADELKKFSEELDIDIDKLAGFKYAADKANVGEAFTSGMRKFAKSMREAREEGSLMELVFKKMDIDPFKDMGVGLDQAIKKFGKMEDGVNKMGLVEEMFGTRNARFTRLLSMGTEGLKDETEELARVMGVSYSEAAEKAAEYNDSLATLKAAFTGLAITFIKEVLPAVVEFNKNFAENLPRYKQLAHEIGVGFVIAINAALLAINSFRAGLLTIDLAILGIAEGVLRFGRWVAESLFVAVEFWLNALVSAVNFASKSVNYLIDHIPSWVKDRLPGGGGGRIPEIEFFKFQSPIGLDAAIKDISGARVEMEKEFRDVQGSVKSNWTAITKEYKKGVDGVVEVVKDGNKKIKKELKEEADDIKKLDAELAAHNAALKKFTGFDQKTKEFSDDPRDQLQKEITGMKADAVGGSFSEGTRMKQERDDVEKNLKEIQKLRDDNITKTDKQLDRLTKMEQMYADKQHVIRMKQAHLEIMTASTMFGDLATIAEAWGGKQSAAYKVMFAASKAFAIADATVKIFQGIAAASANVWPLNLFAMGQVIAATASIVSSISSVSLEFAGEKALGGPVEPGKAFLVGEQGPELFVPSGRGDIVPNNKLGNESAPKTTVVINNYTDVQPVMTEKDDGSGKVVEVMLRKFKNEISSEIRDGRGDIPKAMAQTFGLRRGRS